MKPAIARADVLMQDLTLCFRTLCFRVLSKIAGRVETLRSNAQLLIQGTEIGLEGEFDQGKKCFHAAAVYMGAH